MIHRSKMMIIIALAVAAAPFAGAQAPADQPQTPVTIPADQQPTADQLNRLFDVMRIKQQMASTSRVIPQIMQQQFTQQVEQMQKDHPELAKRTPEQKQASTKVMMKYMSQAMALYNSDEMMADMKVIYQRHLTGSDVENLITFYNSPSGQHMLDMVPVIMQEFMPTAMQKMQDKMRPLVAEMAKELAEIANSPTPDIKPSQEKPDPK
jgi:uncharacterized protein